MPAVSHRSRSVPASGIRRISERAATMTDVIKLSVGEPDVPVAPHILAAGAHAYEVDDTNYAPTSGFLELRQAIVAKLARDNGRTVDLDQVHVTTGGQHALNLAMAITLDPGDEILIPDPGYAAFAMAARLNGAVPAPYLLRPENGYQPELADLEAALTERTRVLLINTPSNPLGVVFPEAKLRELVAFAEAHDLWVIADEVYEYFTYGETHVSPAILTDDPRVISVYSLSKTYALTGGRVGYFVLPKELDPYFRSGQEGSVSSVNSAGQRAAIAAITGPQDAVGEAKAHYEGNVEAACALLDAKGIRYLRPRGAIYLWFDMSHVTDGDVAQWCEDFLDASHVALVPGTAFGASAEGWVRACVAVDRAELLEGLGRLPEPASS